jgi:hypothetical protein
MNTADESRSTAPWIGHQFDEVVVPHLDGAYRWRWIIPNDHDAEDALRNAHASFLRIVRNTCCGWQITGLRRPTRLMKSGTAASSGHWIPRCCSCKLTTSY